MPDASGATPFADINAVLNELCARIQTLLGKQFVGMYLVGSLALDGFDPSSSDIDFIVVTDGELTETLVSALAERHEQVAASGSRWAKRIEAIYVPQAVLCSHASTMDKYPQMEKGARLELTPLEEGWVFQAWTLRERGIVVAGPEPRWLVAPIDTQAMREPVEAIAGMWLRESHDDPSWLDWLRERPNHVFVIQTLCRMLYSLATGEVASKPRATAWAQEALDARWAELIQRSLTAPQVEPLTESEVDETMAFLRYTGARSQQGVG